MIQSQNKMLIINRYFLRFAIIRKSHISRLVQTICAFIFLYGTTIAQTAGVCIKSKNGIVIAADSKVGNRIDCKIRPVLGYFYTIAGYPEFPQFGFSALKIIDTTFKSDKTFIENIENSMQKMKELYPNILKKSMYTKDSTEFRKKFIEKNGVVINIIFAGIDNLGLVAHTRDLQIFWNKKIDIEILSQDCGIDCKKIFTIGRNIEMMAYAKINPVKPNTVLVYYAKRLIEESIRYNPDTVGEPINILMIPIMGNPIWVQRNPPCQTKQ